MWGVGLPKYSPRPEMAAAEGHSLYIEKLKSLKTLGYATPHQAFVDIEISVLARLELCFLSRCRGNDRWLPFY